MAVHSEQSRWRWRRLGLSMPGIVLGLLFFAASLTPSLLPRGPLVQGALSGASFAAGYAVGVFIHWLWAYLQLPEPEHRHARALRIAGGVLALPAVAALFAVERDPRASDPVARAAKARDWTRAEMLRDPLFPLVMLAMAPPAFIGNTIFFHQVHLAELRGWPPEVFASSFTLYAAMTIVFTLVSGQLVDRISGVALLPFYLLPLGLGCVVLGGGGEPWTCFVFMALYGISNGFSFTLFGSLWPELYGVGSLGSIRAVIMAMLVFASAAGPGLAGLLIDAGVGYPWQVVALGIYCLLVSAAMVPVASRLKARRAGASSAAAVAAPGDG